MTKLDTPHLYTVEIKTQRWEELVQWYRNVIGLRVLIRVVDEGYAQLQAGGAHLALIRAETPAEASERVSLAFEVSSLAGLAERLGEAHIEFDEREREGEGYWELVTMDPDGNRLRFFVWPFGN